MNLARFGGDVLNGCRLAVEGSMTGQLLDAVRNPIDRGNLSSAAQ